MKSSQDYIKQNKLAEIREYNPTNSERNAVARYLLAVRNDDTEQIDYFESFGDSVSVIIRNACTYERGVLFGYTERKFDTCGWIQGMLPIIERIKLGKLNTIYIAQSINGIYAVSIDWCTGYAGGGSQPSVWDKPIADYKEAVKQGIAKLEKKYVFGLEHTSDSANYNKHKILKLIEKLKEVKREYLEPKQLSLFDVAM